MATALPACYRLPGPEDKKQVRPPPRHVQLCRTSTLCVFREAISRVAEDAVLCLLQRREVAEKLKRRLEEIERPGSGGAIGIL